MGILLMLCAILIGAGPVRATQFGLVQVRELNVRKGPGLNFAVLARLPQGARVVVTGRENGWLKITHENVSGYILDRESLVRIGSDPARVDSSNSEEFKELGRTAEDIQQQLQASEAELAETEQREREVLAALNASEQELNQARRQVREAEAALSDLRDEVDQIETASADLANVIEASQAYADQRLVALYKLNWVGRIQLLATAESFFDVITRQDALSRILSQDEALLDQLHNEQRSVDTLLEQLNARRAEKRSLELTLTARIDKLMAEQERRSALLTTVRSRKSLARLALLDLQQASRELDSAMQKLQTTPPDRVQPAATHAPRPFNGYKGLLNWPVRGKILTFFGPSRDEKYNVTNFQSGIDIQAERGEPVRAVSEGYTVYASWFKGFGNMLIIDHGDHYYTVYAHLEEVFKVRGDRVEKDEVIATLGDSGSLIGPALHFEVRHHDKPMDPLQWIKNG